MAGRRSTTAAKMTRFRPFAPDSHGCPSPVDLANE